MRWRRVLGVMLGLCLWAAAGAAAVQPADFSCRGLALGDQVAAERLAEVFGTPLFDNERSVFGRRVKYYTFPHDFIVGVAAADSRIVDIIIRSRDYAGRDGVRYGATPYKIMQVFGKVERQFIDGATWYIYRNPAAPEERLLMEAAVPAFTLLSWRITSLPLTEEEAGDWDEEWDNPSLKAAEIKLRPIDMSGLEEAPKEAFTP